MPVPLPVLRYFILCDDVVVDPTHDRRFSIHGLLGNPPFNLVVRSLGPHEKEAAHFHWYIAIVPRVNQSAGFELGTGMYINPVLPEAAAQALREFRG